MNMTDDQLLAFYFDGILDQEEIQELEERLANEPDLQVKYEQFNEL